MKATVNATADGIAGTLSGFVEFCDSDTVPTTVQSGPCTGGTVLATVPVVPVPVGEGQSLASQGTATFILDTSVLYD